MARKKIAVSDNASNSFRRIILNHKKVSLIGGEDAREAILQGIRRIGLNPMAVSESVDFGRVQGEYRLAKVWDCLVLYKVEEKRVIILDIILKAK